MGGPHRWQRSVLAPVVAWTWRFATAAWAGQPARRHTDHWCSRRGVSFLVGPDGGCPACHRPLDVAVGPPADRV